jgi:hypothetical protein
MTDDGTQEIQEPIRELLREYNFFFEEPKGLPPPRTCDHHILLKGTQPISVRPYRYPFYQKLKSNE